MNKEPSIMKMNELCNENELIFEYKRQLCLLRELSWEETNWEMNNVDEIKCVKMMLKEKWEEMKKNE